jgi:hypothetical protein
VAEKLEVIPGGDEKVTEGGIILPNFSGESEVEHALAKFYDGMSRIEKRMPALIDLAFKLSHQVQAWADEKGISTRALKLGTVFWAPDGDIAFDLEYDPHDITPQGEKAFLKTGYRELPKLKDRFPCLIDFVDTMSYSLSNMIDNGQLSIGGTEFSQLRTFKNQMTGNQSWGFRLYDKKRKVKQQRIGL